MAKKRSELERICRAGIPGYDPWATAGKGDRFDETSAEFAIGFIEHHIHHIEGDTAQKLFLLEDWEKAVVGNLFGWKRSDGTRRFREVLVFVPRKNGKTPLVAAIGLHVFINDGERGAYCVCAAGDREQASFVYRQMVGMVDQDAQLCELITHYKGYKSLECPALGATFRVISHEAKTKHGGNMHLGIVDELHVQPDRELVDVLRTATASTTRRQPLVIYMTTSDYDRAGSICNEIVDEARRIRDGVVSDRAFLPVIYEAQPDDDYTDERVWEKANPNLDVSVSRDYLRRECEKAQRSAAHRYEFQRLHLNIRTKTSALWLDVKTWDKGIAKSAVLDGRKCWGALDLSAVRDLTAFARVYEMDEGFVYCRCDYWCPESRVRTGKEPGRVDYRQWVDDGWIRTTPGDVIDYAQIRQDIAGPGGIASQHPIEEIAVDMLFQGHETAQGLATMGFEDRIIAFGQGFMSMAAPTKRFEELVYSHKILHDGNPVTRWMVGNCVVKRDEAGNMKVTKKESTGKVDGVVATIMALGRMMVEEEHHSVYDKRGLLTL